MHSAAFRLVSRPPTLRVDVDGTQLRRLEPPPLDRGQILRPRLLARLAGRWDRRATIVVAGPGFGKSTLLSQALRENLLAPRGADHWLSLTPADNEPGLLLRGIADALDLSVGHLDLSSEGAADEVAGEARSLPPSTCLTLDDLHEIDPSSTAHAALARFLLRLPLQCSVLLSSRVSPSLPMSEWRSKGLVDVISEHELRYTPEELETVVGERNGRPLEVDHGGWPALVELGVVTGMSGSEAFLREAVLAGMRAEDRRRMAALDAIGGGDLPLLGAAMNEDIDAEAASALSSFPMMQRVGSTGLRPHALWQPVLHDILSAQERSALRRRAAVALLAREKHDDAIRLFTEESDWDGVASVIGDACKSGCTQVRFDVLDRWRNALPPHERSRPEAMLVAGIAERASNTFREEASGLLADAAAAFAARGQIGAETATLAELAFVAREQGDHDRVVGVLARLFELDAQGAPEVVGLLRLGRAIVADALDEDAQLLEELAPLRDGELSGQWMSRAEWLRGHAHVLLGRPEQGLPYALRSHEIAEDDFLAARYLDSYARWWIDVDERAINGLPFIGAEAERSPFDEVYGGSMMSALHSYVGNVDIAEESLRIARAAADRSSNDRGPRPEYVGLLASAAAALAVAKGDEEGARELLIAFFNEYPATTPVGRRVARRWCGLVAVLLEDQRQAVFDAGYGPAIAEARSIVGWFIRMRAGDRLAPPIAEPEKRLLNALPLRWAIEAAARFAQFDLEGARRMCERLVGVRGPIVRLLLRECADGKHTAFFKNAGLAPAPVDGAKKLLTNVPVAPSEPLVVRVLGPLQIARGQKTSDAPEMRRERARQIIVSLAALGPTSRETLMDRFWPELDRTAGAQNLRTTLNYVHKLLEPERGPGDAPFVLRQNGELLSLVGPPWLETDLARFTRHCDNAEGLRRTGVHSGEVEELERALNLVRGEPLVDVLYEDWAAPMVRNVRARISASAQRAAELRFAAGHHDLAQTSAAICMRFDPWNESANTITVTSLLAQGRIAAARDALQTWRGVQSDLGLGRNATIEMLERRLGVVASA